MAFVPYIEEGGKILPSYSFAWRNRQSKPYKDPLPYERFVRLESGCKYLYETQFYPSVKTGVINENKMSMITAYANTYHGLGGNNGDVSAEINNLRVGAHNKALNKLSDKLSYVSNLFEAWYERKEAYTLLGQCLKSMYNLLKNWKKPTFWKNLMSSAGKKAKQPETLPEAWLLLQFAIKPLIGTIDDVMNLLLKDFPLMWEDASSGATLPLYKWPTAYEDELYFESSQYIVKHGVRYTALNPNAQLSNIMGLTTPMSTFANVLPWVWAVNYFVNLNEVISNFEIRFPGITVDKSYTTVVSRARHYGSMLPEHSPPAWNTAAQDWYPKTSWVKYDGTSVHFKRTVSSSVPKYKLERKFPALGSNQFANLTSAIALTMKGKAK